VSIAVPLGVITLLIIVAALVFRFGIRRIAPPRDDASSPHARHSTPAAKRALIRQARATMNASFIGGDVNDTLSGGSSGGAWNSLAAQQITPPKRSRRPLDRAIPSSPPLHGYLNDSVDASLRAPPRARVVVDVKRAASRTEPQEFEMAMALAAAAAGQNVNVEGKLSFVGPDVKEDSGRWQE